LRQDGTADLASASDYALYRVDNSQKVSTTSIVNGKYITFVVSNDTVKDGQSVSYSLKAKINTVENNGETYKFTLKNTADLNTVEKTTGFSTKVNTAPVTLATYTINGGDLKLTRDSSISTTPTYAPGQTSVVLLKGTIEAKQAISLEDINVPFTSSVNANVIAKRYTLTIGSSTFTWNGTAATVGTALFEWAVSVNGIVPITLTADIDTNAPSSTIKFGPIQWSSFVIKEYVSTQNPVTSIIGTIAGANVTINTSRLTVTSAHGFTTKNIVKGSSSQLIYGVKLSTNDTNPIKVTRLDLTSVQTAAGIFNGNVTLTLQDSAGNALNTKTLNAASNSFDGLNVIVSKDAPVTMYVKADFVDTVAIVGGSTFQLNVSSFTATDTVTSNTVVASPVLLNGPVISIQNSGKLTLSTSSSTPSSAIVVAGATNAEVAKFNAKSENDTVKITDLYFENDSTLTNPLNFDNRVSSATLEVGAKSYQGSVRNNMLVFEGMSDNEIIPGPNGVTYAVKLNLNTVTNSTDLTNNEIRLKLKATPTTPTAGTDLPSWVRAISIANGETLAGVNVAPLATAISNKHIVTNGSIVVAKVGWSISNNQFAEFTVNASSNKVSVDKIYMKFNKVATAASMTIYKDSIAPGNIVAATPVWAAAQTTYTLTTPVDVNAGSSVKFIVVLDNPTATLNGTQPEKMEGVLTQVDFIQTFTDNTTSAVNTAGYANLGTFPMTWSQP
jgi:hypothetical protein